MYKQRNRLCHCTVSTAYENTPHRGSSCYKLGKKYVGTPLKGRRLPPAPDNPRSPRVPCFVT